MAIDYSQFAHPKPGQQPRKDRGGLKRGERHLQKVESGQGVPGVRTYRGGREVCDRTTKAGSDEYERRRRAMWIDQGRRCFYCGNDISEKEATFEHWEGRGLGGGKRDDRVQKLNPETGKMEPYNCAACTWCNGDKGSKTKDQYLKELAARKK